MFKQPAMPFIINFLLTFIFFCIKLQLLFRCSCSSIGNPVKVGDGPAAVVPPFSDGKGEPFQPCVPLFQIGNGKAAERAGKSENLPERMGMTFADRGAATGS